METAQQLVQQSQHLQEAYNRITKLQNEVLNICAWTKQVNVDGKWVSVDEYLSRHLGLKLSHGISEQGISILEKEAGIPLPFPKEGTADKEPEIT